VRWQVNYKFPLQQQKSLHCSWYEVLQCKSFPSVDVAAIADHLLSAIAHSANASLAIVAQLHLLNFAAKFCCVNLATGKRYCMKPFGVQHEDHILRPYTT
jgi:hypothetical protein